MTMRLSAGSGGAILDAGTGSPDDRWTLYGGDLSGLIDTVDELTRQSVASLMVTMNTEHVALLRADAQFRAAYATAALRVVDGAPLAWLSRVIGARDVEVHSGADLLDTFAAESQARGWRIALLGGNEGAAQEAARRLGQRHVGCDVVPFEFPRIHSVPDPSDADSIERLRGLEPNIVFVCLGAPKQEEWIAHWLGKLPPALYVGAGATIDFAAGRFVRAPKPVRRIGAEWMWRLAQEPRRLAARYGRAAISMLRLIVASLAPRQTG